MVIQTVNYVDMTHKLSNYSCLEQVTVQYCYDVHKFWALEPLHGIFMFTGNYYLITMDMTNDFI